MCEKLPVVIKSTTYRCVGIFFHLQFGDKPVKLMDDSIPFKGNLLDNSYAVKLIFLYEYFPLDVTQAGRPDREILRFTLD